MSSITTKDGTEIFYKDWGSGQPIVFHHGWPLSGDDWDTQMLYFLGQGYRVIAHDRRGHGRSSQTSKGHEMNTYAADVAELVAKLDLRDAIHIGHSTGGGELTRYVARHGAGRVAKAAFHGGAVAFVIGMPDHVRAGGGGAFLRLIVGAIVDHDDLVPWRRGAQRNGLRRAQLRARNRAERGSGQQEGRYEEHSRRNRHGVTSGAEP